MVCLIIFVSSNQPSKSIEGFSSLFVYVCLSVRLLLLDPKNHEVLLHFSRKISSQMVRNISKNASLQRYSGEQSLAVFNWSGLCNLKCVI